MLSRSKFVFIALVVSGLVFCLSNVSSAWEESPARVTVTVTGLGTPIEGAEVNFGDYSETTGANVSVIFSVDKGTYAASCSAPHGGSGSTEVRVVAGEITQVVFELGSEALHASGH